MGKLFLFLLGFVAFSVHAQNEKLITYAQQFRPLVVIISSSPDEQVIMKEISLLPNGEKEKYHYLLFWGPTQKTEEVTKSINDILNVDDNISIDQQRIYLLLLAAPADLRSQLLGQAIFADQLSLPTGLDQANISFPSILKNFAKQNLWVVELDRIKEKNVEARYQDKRLGLGLAIGRHNQNISREDDAYIPNRITKLGLLANYRLADKIQLMGRIQGSFQIPSQKKLQNEITSQLDFSAGGEQRISAEIKIHIFVQTSLQANYLFNTRKKIQGFTGLGLSLISFRSAQTKIRQTIDISSGLGGGFGQEALSGQDLPFVSRTFLAPFITAGATYKLSRKSNLMLNMDYFFPNQGSGEEVIENQNTQQFSLGLGLQFFFGRKSVYYHYVKHKDNPVAIF
jgi:hypothetical protein